MIDEIAEKLRALLYETSPFSNEKDVLYFLAEIRKVLEHSNTKKKYPFITFYSDWSLHIEKSKNFSDEVTLLLQSIASGSEDEGIAFLEMEHLKKELSNLLPKYNLVDFTSDDEKWLPFFFYLSRILNDQEVLPDINSKPYVVSAKYSYAELAKHLVWMKIKTIDINGKEKPLQFMSPRYGKLLIQKGLWK